MSFEPICSATAQILIVGTWPSPKSREEGFYYGHPQNRFWSLLARLLDAPVPETIAEKTALITENNLA
ncbi:MAG: DNA-deoxyinosine glycosylase, partial [Ruthenibacterium sp.]